MLTFLAGSGMQLSADPATNSITFTSLGGTGGGGGTGGSYSVVVDSVAPSPILSGMLWYNTDTAKLLVAIPDESGTPRFVDFVNTGGGSSDVIVSATVPDPVVSGSFWYNTDEAELFVAIPNSSDEPEFVGIVAPRSTISHTFIIDATFIDTQLGNGLYLTKQVAENCTISKVSMISNTGLSGTISVSIEKANYSSYPSGLVAVSPSVISLTDSNKYQDTGLSGWSTSLTAGDILRFKTQDSNETLSSVSIFLEVNT